MSDSRARIFQIAQRYRGRLLLSQVLLFIAALATIGMATQTEALVNEGIGGGDVDAAIAIGWTMLVLALVSAVCLGVAAVMSVLFAHGTAYTIRTELYEWIQRFAFADFDRLRTNELMVRLTSDTLNVQNGMLMALMLGLYAPFLLTIAVILVAINTPELLWLLLLVIGIVVVIVVVLMPAILRNYQKRQVRLDDLNGTLQENLTGIQVVKAFTREDSEVERFSERSDTLRATSFAAAWRVALLGPLLSGVGSLATIALLYVSGILVLEEGTVDVGQVVAFSQYLSLAIAPLAIMAIVVPAVLRGNTSLGRIVEVLETEPAIQGSSDAKPVDLEEVKGRIEFENVTFAFPNPDGGFDPPALKGIDLVIEPGERVGFLGATGAGKTALVNLLPRFYDVTEGRITIDGHDVRDLPLDNLRDIVGIALQEAVLFQGDLRFNLKFADPDADDAVMLGAAKAADSFGFVSNIPEQWDAPVARRGYNFSGGQRQRLSITRALVQKPRILVLDDSTSALDATTEGRVQGAIPGFTNGVTTLYVAQRISAVIELDKIVLMEDGAIVAIGTHDELLGSNELYRSIYESQLGSDVLEGITLPGPEAAS